MPDPLNVALVGYGYAGATLHAPLISSVAGLNLVAVCSSDAAKVLADLPTVNVSRSIDDLLAWQEIDIVVIATPNQTHFELARQALLAGKHVVVDKPFTITTAQARELKKIAEQGERVLSVFHNRRWDADFLTLRSVIDSGKLGDIVRLESRFDRYRPEVRPRWREQAGAGSGLWYDLGPHLLDQAILLFGKPKTIQAELSIQRPGAQTIDYFHVTLGYENLEVVLRAGLLQKEATARFELKGRKGSYTKYGIDTQEETLKQGGEPGGQSWGNDPQNGLLRLFEASATSKVEVSNLKGDYRSYYELFRDSVNTNANFLISMDEVLLNVELIELGIVSSKNASAILHLSDCSLYFPASN